MCCVIIRLLKGPVDHLIRREVMFNLAQAYNLVLPNTIRLVNNDDEVSLRELFITWMTQLL